MINSTLIPRAIPVVEDNKDLRRILQAKLASFSFRVTTTANGQDATAELNREKFDLVLTDVFMPGKDGMEVLRELYKSHPTMPVVVMSGGGSKMRTTQYLGAAQLLGAVAVLEKPFTDEQLWQAIALVLPERTA